MNVLLFFCLGLGLSVVMGLCVMFDSRVYDDGDGKIFDFYHKVSGIICKICAIMIPLLQVAYALGANLEMAEPIGIIVRGFIFLGLSILYIVVFIILIMLRPVIMLGKK